MLRGRDWIFSRLDALIASVSAGGGELCVAAESPFEEVLQLVNCLLDEADTDGSPQERLCVQLADALHASAAVYLCLEWRTQICTMACWPSTIDVLRGEAVVQRVSAAFPLIFAQVHQQRRPSCVSADADTDLWPGTVADRVLWELLDCRELAQIPLLVSETQLRLVALARYEKFSARDMDFLRVAQRPLGAVDRVLRALAPGSEDPHGATMISEFPIPAEPGGDCGLTPREMEVLRLLADGLLATTIATRMNVSRRTVHKHLGNLYRKLDAHDRLLAVRRAQAIGLVPT